MEDKPKILAVDDDIRNLEIIKEIIEDTYDLDTVISGEEALEKISQEVPDIVLLDIMMSGIDGYETCKRIKAMKDIVPPKIILVSGKALVEERLQGYDVGADDYLTKPFNDDEFLAKIKVFLKLIATEKELRELSVNLEKQVQERTKQLVEAEKVAFLGMHVAETVHNLKSPLTIIKASAQKLSKEIPNSKLIDRINRGGEKLDTIIKSILASDTEMNEVVDINNVINAELDLLRGKPVFHPDIQVDLDLGDIPKIKGNEIHFNQIVANIAGNAIDAMHDVSSKTLTIKTAADDDSIVMTIADSGTGIEKDNIEKIFDPFFTTKPIESKSEDEPTGTGLGLPSCKKMVESYSGTLEVESEIGKGTSFVIKLPIKK